MKGFLLVTSIIISVFFLSHLAIAQGNQTVISGNQTLTVNFPAAGCTYNWVNSTPGIGLPASGTGDIAAFKAVNTGNIPIKATITATPIATEFGYIVNSSDKTVSIINTLTNKVVSTIQIPATGVLASIAVNSDGTKAYILDSYGHKIFYINALTNQVITSFQIGETNPSYILESPDGSRLYVIDQGANRLSMYSTANNSYITSIPVNIDPETMAISPDGTRLYITNWASKTVSVIDTATLGIIATIDLTFYSPQFIAVSPEGKRVYVTSKNGSNITAIDAKTNTIIATNPLYGSDPEGLAVSPDGSKVYIANQTSNDISVIDATTDKYLYSINIPFSVGLNPINLSFSSDGTSLYVINYNSNNVSVINTNTRSIINNIPVGANPNSIGNFISTNIVCNSSPITFTITVAPSSVTPVITSTPAVGSITACPGSASASLNLQQFTVYGTNLTGNIMATAPTGFELSLNTVNSFGNSVTIPQSGGSVNGITVFVRSSASASAGNISGNVTLSSQGANSQSVAVHGTINPLPVVNKVTNQTFNAGNATTAINFTGTGTAYSWTNSTPGIGLAANGVGDIPSFTAVNTGTTPITATITVTPVPSGLVFAANSIDGTVSVVSTLTNKLVATIPVGSKPEGVSVSPDGSRVYVTNRGSNSVTVIDPVSNNVISTIPVEQNPLGVAVSPDGTKVYVANQGSNTVSVINALTGTITSTITVGSQPAGVCVSPNGNTVYVANFNDGTVSVINAVTNAVIASIHIGGNPFGVAVNPNGSQLYVSNETLDVYEVNTVSNTVIASTTLSYAGAGRTRGLAVSADGKYLYVANGFNVQQVYIPLFAGAGITANPWSLAIGVSMSPDGTHIFATNGASLELINPMDPYIDLYEPSGKGPDSFGNFTSAGTGCSGAPITFTITVNPASIPPVIIAGTATGTISACQGSASASPNIAQFTVSGTGLTNDITATAPSGFEVCLTASGVYGNTVTIPQSGGKVTNTVAYVRSAASATGTISGNVTLTSQGANTQNVTVTGKINPLPTVNPVGNQIFITGNNTTAINFTGTAAAYSWVNNMPAIGLPANGTGDISSFTAVNTGTSPVTATITVTPVPPPAGFAYIANSGVGNGTVSVINTANNSVVATIPLGQSPTGVAISPDGGKVYISDQALNKISVLNAATNTVISTITEFQGAEPSGVAVSPDGTKLYVANYNSYTFSGMYIYNTATNALIASIPISGFPYGVVISHDGSRVYVEASDAVTVINTATNTIMATIPVGAADNSYISISPDDSRLYVSNNYTNTVSVIDATVNTVISVIQVGKSPSATFVSPDGSKLYVENTIDGTISIINTATNSVINTIAAGPWPLGISVTADGRTIYVINGSSKSVTVIDALTYQIITKITVGAGPYSLGNFISGGSGCSGLPKTFTITVNPAPVTPVITSGTVTGMVSACEGTASTSPNIAQFTVSGSNLTNDIVATAPLGFEISLSSTGGYGNSVTVKQAGGKVNNVTIYVGLAASAAGSISGNVILTSPGATDQGVAVTGKINPLPTVNPVGKQVVVSGMHTTGVIFTGTASTYNWVNDNPAIGIAYGTSTNIVPFIATNTGNTPVIGTFTVTPINTATGCNGKPITFTIEVDPILPADITATGTLSSLSTIYGTPSASTSFSVSGTSMNAGILVTPPAGFEVSTDNTNFSQTVTVGSPGTIAATTVYIRLTSKTPVSSYLGYITLSSAGAMDASVPVPISVVNTAPLTITANNVQKRSGQTLTSGIVSTGFTSSGLQNNETIGSVFITYGEGADAAAKVGTYAGSAVPSGARGGSFDPKNYTITYQAGDIIVTESIVGGPITIPNAFTPNGDGINDVWNIKSLIDYPSCLVSIFTRYGSMIYQSRGYAKPWDGVYNGSVLPTGTYYYIIDLQNGQPPLSGYVALIR